MNPDTLAIAADDDGRPWIEVYVGRAHSVADDGALTPDDGDYAFVERAVYYTDVRHPGVYRPSLLRRDVDMQPRRHATDVVVQGVWRTDHPVQTATCSLACRGDATFQHTLALFGDRVVERGPVAPRFTAPAPFTELPIRYDRAYGGTDEAAAAADPDPYDEAVRSLVSPAAFLESSSHSYPRNPAGVGYVVADTSLVGTLLPNLEWPDRLLTVDRMVLPLDRWDERPLPAAFDWYGHSWFPRVAFFDNFEPTQGNRTPAAEVALGILPPDLRQRTPAERPSDAFFQGAHPRLWRHRLRGDEILEVSGMSPDGRDTIVRLPSTCPHVRTTVEGRSARGPAALDLVLLDTETRRLTLVWRARLPSDDITLLHRPELRADISVGWRRLD